MSRARTPLDAAGWYASLGWYTFPVERHGKRPVADLVPHGKDDATTDVATLERGSVGRAAARGTSASPVDRRSWW